MLKEWIKRLVLSIRADQNAPDHYFPVRDTRVEHSANHYPKLTKPLL